MSAICQLKWSLLSQSLIFVNFIHFLLKWKNISSSTGLNDLGICYLVKHAINLSDETPFKEPHKRISPAVFQEVREHTKEVLEVGVIRTSTSSFSSNVVVVRKKDGSFHFCVDYRRLNNRTIKDAQAIPSEEDNLHLQADQNFNSFLTLTYACLYSSMTWRIDNGIIRHWTTNTEKLCPVTLFTFGKMAVSTRFKPKSYNSKQVLNLLTFHGCSPFYYRCSIFE